jgi:hypothetical protein
LGDTGSPEPVVSEDVRDTDAVSTLNFVPVVGSDANRSAPAAILERTFSAARVRRSDHNARRVRSRAASAPPNPARPDLVVFGLPVSGPYAPRFPWSVALGQSLGHDLMVTAGLVWCRSCAGYLCHFPRLLRAQCDKGRPRGSVPLPSRAHTLRRLFRGEHPDSGKHIGVPRSIPALQPSLASPSAPNGAVVRLGLTTACSSRPVSCSQRPAPNGDAGVSTLRALSATARAAHCPETSPALSPSLLEVSLSRAALRVEAKATTNGSGFPRHPAPPVLLHPSAHSAPDPCLGSRPGSVGVVTSRRARFRF